MNSLTNSLDNIALEPVLDLALVPESLTDSFPDTLVDIQDTSRTAVQLDAGFSISMQGLYNVDDASVDLLLPVLDSEAEFLPEDDEDFGQGSVHYQESSNDDDSTTVAATEDSSSSSSNMSTDQADDGEPLPWNASLDSFDLRMAIEKSPDWMFQLQDDSVSLQVMPVALETTSRSSPVFSQAPPLQQTPMPFVPLSSNATIADTSSPATTARPAKVLSNIKKNATTPRKPPICKGKRTPAKKKRRNRVRRVHDPDEDHRTYVEIDENLDVLLGRGGKTNQNPGNLLYHQDKLTLQDDYHDATKEARTHIAQQLVDMVEDRGGRFLNKDANGWWIVSNHTARTKAGQALRERYTPEERAQKRARYRLKKKSEAKKNNTTKAQRGQ